PLNVPPLDSTYRKCSSFSSVAEPWNIRCSKRCAKPVRPSGSERNPTSYSTAMPTTGALRSGAISTRSPLPSVWWTRSNVGAGSVRAATSAGLQAGPAEGGEPVPQARGGLRAVVQHAQRDLLVRRVDLVVRQADA